MLFSCHVVRRLCYGQYPSVSGNKGILERHGWECKRVGFVQVQAEGQGLPHGSRDEPGRVQLEGLEPDAGEAFNPCFLQEICDPDARRSFIS